MPRRVVIAGGTGFLGTALTKHFASMGNEIVVLTRHPRPSVPGGIRHVHWNGKSVGEWASELNGAQAVINLAGKSINCRFTPENKREIITSRVDSVKAIGAAIAKLDDPPATWAQAGVLAIYGDAGDSVCDESAPHGSDFLAQVAREWEAAVASFDTPATRKSVLRIGVVLGKGGGVLAPLFTLARWFLGGAAGSGRQYVSWVHIEDLNEMFQWAITRPDISGAFNATSPNPVSNAEFMREIRRVVHRPWSPPVPSFMIRLGAFLMGTDARLVLQGQRCVPAYLTNKGFNFKYPDLRSALEAICLTTPQKE